MQLLRNIFIILMLFFDKMSTNHKPNFRHKV